MSEKIKKAAVGISLLLSCILPLSEMFGEELSFRVRKDFAVGFQPMSIVSGDLKSPESVPAPNAASESDSEFKKEARRQ